MDAERDVRRAFDFWEGRLELRYLPFNFRLGLFLSLAALLGLAAVTAYYRRLFATLASF